MAMSGIESAMNDFLNSLVTSDDDPRFPLTPAAAPSSPGMSSCSGGGGGTGVQRSSTCALSLSLSLPQQKPQQQQPQPQQPPRQLGGASYHPSLFVDVSDPSPSAADEVMMLLPSGQLEHLFSPPISSTAVGAKGHHPYSPPKVATPQGSKTPHLPTNIFVAGIPTTWDEAQLKEFFLQFGGIVSVRMVRERHFGFVMFSDAAAAHAAINATHLLRPCPQSNTIMHVSIAMHDEGVGEEPNERVFVRGLPQWATKEVLHQCFDPFGSIVDCAVLINPMGQCKGSGFVQFSSVEEATAAVTSQKEIRIPKWNGELVVKYSETIEVRQQRQERNRNRQKRWAAPNNLPGGGGTATCSANTSPSLGMAEGYGSQIPSPAQTPLYPMFMQQPIQVLTSPSAGGGVPGYVVSPHAQSAMAAQLAQQSPPVSSAPALTFSPAPFVPTSSYGSNAVTPSAAYFAAPSSAAMYMMSSPISSPMFPTTNDLHISGFKGLDSIVRLVTNQFGAVSDLKLLDNGEGVAVRMKDRKIHASIAQKLHGTMLPDGSELAVGLYM